MLSSPIVLIIFGFILGIVAMRYVNNMSQGKSLVDVAFEKFAQKLREEMNRGPNQTPSG